MERDRNPTGLKEAIERADSAGKLIGKSFKDGIRATVGTVVGFFDERSKRNDFCRWTERDNDHKE